MSASDDIEYALQQAWFRAEGIVPPDDRIHPADDMYHWDESLGLDLACRRAEYMRSGHEALAVLRNVVSTTGGSLKDAASVLDFAGGYGRLTRFLVSELDAARISTADVLTGAVDFVRDTFGVDGFYSATDPAELRFDRRYAVIWVGSLFSHLPRARFGPFLAKLFGALEPNGLLVFSTHGNHALSEDERDPSGFTFRRESESAKLDTAEYGATFVEPDVVRAIASSHGIEHLWSLEHELWRIQDLYVASPTPHAGLTDWQHAPTMRGGIPRAEIDAAGHAWIGGWVRTPAHAAPVEQVTLHIDELGPITTTLAPLAEALPQSEGGATFRQFDWYVEGPTDALAPGLHTLCAVAQSAKGRGAFAAKVLTKP